MQTKAGMIFLTLGLFQAEAVRAQEGAYRLGVQDRLRIHVHEWPVLTGEFAIGPDGKITLPMIGDVPATGLASGELASRIAEAIKAKAQLLELPDTAVSVAQYRPFYILGGVERPGEYAYRPQMVVLNAVTIAGGIYRPPRTSDWGFERDSITGRGDLRTVLVKRNEFAAREWRLKAEAAGLEALPVAEGVAASSRFIDEERGIFNARIERHRNQIKAYGESVILLEREIVSIQAQSKAAEKQKESVARELEETRGLIARGLAPAPRILPLERTVAQIEREQRELETAVLRARQQINLIASQRSALQDDRQSAALAELHTILAQVKELDERFETSSRLIAGSMAMSSAPSNADETDSDAKFTFVILRPVGEEIRELQATETTRILPGDILKVFRPQDTARSASPASQRRSSQPGSEPPAKERFGSLDKSFVTR
ncbi:polysaccharide biosynthesis/export family protein [Bosea sp. 124]|uniref:polysaccharide biosynthesis/export family protein n=1 Tax=Bosea sp. 124 TaxID=2135642 RepID=UPI000D4EEE05|nr:polysaccharide biosynthesis/export family protein [Bosea sp. 124]PTM41490.1 exopolysaccharide production protein ExoF [Bosea sp. 124]